RQRWFPGDSRKIKVVSVMDWITLSDASSALALAEVQYQDTSREVYLLPLTLTFAQDASNIASGAVISPVVSAEGPGVLYDGLSDAGCLALLSLLEQAGELSSRHGFLRGLPIDQLQSISRQGGDPPAIRQSWSESGNTIVNYGDQCMLKIFRHQDAGKSTDSEIEQYLTQSHFDGVPPFLASMKYAQDGKQPATLGILQGFVPNEGDGWQWTLDELERYFEECAPSAFPKDFSLPSNDLFAFSEDPLPDFV